MQISAPEYMIVCQPEFMKEVDRILEDVPLEDIKAYVRWHILNGAANFLGDEFDKRYSISMDVRSAARPR